MGLMDEHVAGCCGPKARKHMGSGVWGTPDYGYGFGPFGGGM